MFSVNLDLYVMSLNVRGLRDSIKRNAIFLFCKSKRTHCALLQETHSNDGDEKLWSNQWGDKVLFCHGTNRSAGTAILLNNFPGKVVTSKKDINGHWILCVMSLEHSFLILGNIYGYNNINQNKKLLSEIDNIIKEFKIRYPTSNVILGGDFNMVYNEWLDRSPTKFYNHQYNAHLSNFCNSLNLIDPWRTIHPDLKQFSWLKPDGSSRSRIDFWLISDWSLEQTADCLISAAPLSDHCFISLTLKPINAVKRNKGYWKFNASLLHSEAYCQGVKDIINEITDDASFSSHSSRWEFLKFRIRNFSRSFSKQLKQSFQREEANLVREISLCCSKPTTSDTDKGKLLTLQTKLDELYIHKAKGAYIRSRAKWIEDGERNSSYFCRLEKTRQVKNNIGTLLIDNKECSDPEAIAKEIYSFYNNLYSSSFSLNAAETFFDKIKGHIPQISKGFRDSCETEISHQELDKALQCLNPDRSPGPDGLTTNFYKHFWDHIKTLLFETLQETIKKIIIATNYETRCDCSYSKSRQRPQIT